MQHKRVNARTSANTALKVQIYKEFLGKKFNKRLTISKSSKSQSAMEYLMTYGWAILIIAIVMVALFQLGVFNGTFFAPHATAGACEVYRSVDGTNLVGQCQGELPQFVAQFNGASSYITTGQNNFPIGSGARSVFG